MAGIPPAAVYVPALDVARAQTIAIEGANKVVRLTPVLVRRCQFTRVILLAALALLLPSAVQGQPAEPGLLPGWKEIADRPGLTSEQRAGAQFAGQHLPASLFNQLPQGHQEALLRYAADHSQGDPQLVICWESHTPDFIVKPYLEIEYAGKLVKQARQRAGNFPIGTAYQADDADHWNRTASNGTGQGTQGLPITLTWSVVPDGTLIPGGQVSGEGSNEPSNLRAWLAGIYGGSSTGPAAAQPWFPILQAVFDNIAAKTGVRYVYEPNDDGAQLSNFSSGQGSLGVRGDVRISGHALDGNYNVLAYNYYPDFSDMVIDTSDSYFNNTANNSRVLRNVIEHEHGHGLGLGHVCPTDGTKLMEPFINLGFLGIQFDDIFTIQRLYGDFLEPHGSERSNDTFATATPLALAPGVPFAAEWLGIDDNSDADYFNVSLPADTQLTVRVIPSSAGYLEGGVNASDGSCTAGTPFDSSNLQDLGLTLYAPDQSTVLGSAINQPAGVTEQLIHVPILSPGTHYLRVTGSGANVNQLYRLEIEVNPLAVALVLSSATVTEELWPGGNGVPDPGETVRLAVDLINVGTQTATNVEATLNGSAGFQPFAVSQSYGSLDSGSSAARSFTFAFNGECGDALNLSLDLQVNGAPAGSLPIDMTLGTKTPLLTEDFEAGNALPSGWSTTETGSGSLWSIVANPGNPGHNSAFAQDAYRWGQSILTTPAITAGATPGKLMFTHYYNTQSGRDGGVLEIEVNGGGWQDIVSAGGAFLAGGYNSTLNGSLNPIDSRNAWSGDSAGFISTVVQLPPSTANQSVRFRWILGHDRSSAGDGWYLDDIDLSEVACDSGVPGLILSSTDTQMAEYFTATDTANVTVSAALPVATDLPVTLQAAGSADAVLDVSGFASLTLGAGQSSTTLVLRAISDAIVEGTEVLNVTSPNASGTVQISILDTPYGQFAATNLGTIGAVNPYDDFDLDGSLNVEELVFGTDLTSASSHPVFALVREGLDFRLPVPLTSLPPGIMVSGEATTDFATWLPDGVTVVPDGLLIPGDDPQRFLRLKYSVLETAP
ncbi:MAG: matrixin family metalloprotease [Verrucomicrobia bacterium]|nr:matrixin family metalloprotease [Verrucomicrobiota bacterium]